MGEQTVAVSVPVPAQRFYGREDALSAAVLAWVRSVTEWFAEAK
ncbi:transcriptional regulator [Mycobacterium tuberculosis]|nr:transcriptional regulator [Mycobacterium tuberculosis]